MFKTVCVDTINAIQNNQHMETLDKGTMMTRDKWKDYGVHIYNFLLDLQRLGFEIVLVLGYEGSGKSYGIKYLNPETNIWFHTDDKKVTFKGGKQAYFEDGDYTKPKPNYRVPKDYDEIIKTLTNVKAKGLMAPNPIAFVTGHIEDYKSEDGEIRQRLKVLGSMATKFNIEGKVTHCYYTSIMKKGDKIEYKLRTQNTGSNTGRSPEGAFEELYIDNNFQTIVDAIEAY